MSSINDELAALAVANVYAAATYQAALTSSSNAAQAHEQAAKTEADAQVQVANIEADAQRDIAKTEAASRYQVAQTDNAWHVQVANIEADARRDVANTTGNATTQAAKTSADATTSAAQTSAGATTQAATTDANARRDVANTQAQAQNQVAQTDAQARRDVANTEATASNYRADQEYAGVTAHETAETGRLNTKLAFASDKFNQVFPLVSGVATAATGTLQGGSSGGIGFHASRQGSIGFTSSPSGGDQIGTYEKRTLGSWVDSPQMAAGDIKTGGIGFATGVSVADTVAATQLPFISPAGVLTPSQVQAQVNAAYARNDAKVQSEIRRLVGDMSGRGFSANSPIASAFQVGIVGQGLRASLQAETQIRLDSAKMNRDAMFQGQKAVADQFTQQEQVLVDDAKNGVTRTVGILSAITGMVGAVV